jgi:hypothetical protein
MVGGSAQEGRAWYLGCCWDHLCHRDCCSRYTTTLCIRPYNAFSPCCYGNIVADGCMPINLYGGQLPCMRCPAPMCMPPCCGPNFGGGCCSSGCCESGCLPPPGTFAGAPMMQAMPGQAMPQGQPGQQFTPPTPTPLGPTSYMPMPAYGYGPVQPVGYSPMYNPYYNPMYGYGMPYQGQMPGYWYGR